MRNGYLLLLVSMLTISTLRAQEGALDFDLLQTRVLDNRGLGMVSPYADGWFREGSVEVRVGTTPFFDPGFPLGNIRIAFLSELRGPRGELIARSNTPTVLTAQAVTFVSGTEEYSFRGNQINFISALGESDGRYGFLPPYSATTRLPAGVYRHVITIHRVEESGRVLEALSAPWELTFGIPPEDVDFELQVSVRETSPYFSDWASNPDAAEVRVRNI